MLASLDHQQLVETALEAWRDNDLDAWLETLHPDIVYHTSGVFPGLQQTYSGYDGIRQFWRDMHEPWEELRPDLERIVELDDERVVVEFRFRAIGAESGARVDLRFCNAGRVRDGLTLELFAARTFEEAVARLEE